MKFVECSAGARERFTHHLKDESDRLLTFKGSDLCRASPPGCARLKECNLFENIKYERNTKEIR